MASNLQQLAEDLARRLQRSVAIDDTRMRLLAYSPHSVKVDPLRAESILQRAVPQEVVELVYTSADETNDPFEVTARTGLGMNESRLGFRIVHENVLCGFIWLLASEGIVDDETHQALKQSADAAAIILHREHLMAGHDREQEDRLVSKLLGNDSERELASAEVVAEGLFVYRSFSVIVCEFDLPAHLVTEEDRLALSSALATMRSTLPARHTLSLERRGAAVMLVSDTVSSRSRDKMMEIAKSLRNAVAEHTDGCCRVGVGRFYSELAEAWRSYDEARRAIRASCQVTELGTVVSVEAIGIYDLLTQIPSEALAAAVLPGLSELAERETVGDSLLLTLETFLDNGGNVKATSEQLYIHRTSLYYRLRRVQEATGLDLNRGDDQLIAHLGLKIIRLTEAG